MTDKIFNTIRKQVESDRDAYAYYTAAEIGRYGNCKADTVHGWNMSNPIIIGQTKYYDIREAIAHLVKPARQSVSDVNTTRAALNKAQERRIKISSLEAEKRLVPTKEVEFIVTNMVTELKQNLIALPSRIIDDIMLCKGKEETKEYLEKAIAAVLEGMSAEFSLKAQKSKEFLSAEDIDLMDLEEGDLDVEEI